MPTLRKIFTFLSDVAASLLGTAIIALNVPWMDVLSTSTPGGGDNPAHPVLMQSVTDAFLQHGSIIHYSTSFWSGFELFQFYFPLPYLFGGLLGHVIHPHIAFKLITLLPILLLPPAFWVMARLMGFGRVAAAMASLLAVSFLHTEAHVMWGGNVSSTLAGMIGNSWAFVFFSICVGALFRSRDTGRFSLLAVLTFVAAALSHFYAALMLFVLGCVFVAEDILKTILGEFNLRRTLPSYLACILAGVLVAWWVLPLIYYTRYSTDFGANWDVQLLRTFTHYEIVFAGLALLITPLLLLTPWASRVARVRTYLFIALLLAPICAYVYYNLQVPLHNEGASPAPTPWWIQSVLPYTALIAGAAFAALLLALFLRSKDRDWTALRIFVFGSIFFISFFANEFLNSTAFLNIRLWPSIYFSLYLLVLFVFSRLHKLMPLPVVGLSACLFLFLVPPQESFKKTYDWMSWNYSGIEAKPGAKDFAALVEILRQQPPGRVSFESSDDNNGIFGTVRAFEMLPFLTHHTIVEGGILNSARFPGVGYMLQCLSSNSCAGWPAGTIMPGTDIPRAIEVMRMLGVSYHIAVQANTKKGFEESGQFKVLFQGKFATLYSASEPSPMVEVYDREPPVIPQRWPYTTLLNQPRWDRLRSLAFIYDTNLAPSPARAPIDARTLFNFLAQEWHAGRRVSHDLGWEPVAPEDPSRRLNGYLFSLRARFDLQRELREGPNFFIADRGFDPDLFVSNLQYGDSELALPLVRTKSGTATIKISGRGYFAFVGETEIPFEEEVAVTFTEQTINGSTAPFALITFKNDPSQQYRYADVRTEDHSVTPGLPGPASLDLPERITTQCSPRLETSFHRMTLHTACPGKPHLIKYSYYPKWQTEVPIYLGSNGYMLLTPLGETTNLRHVSGSIDHWSGYLSLAGCVTVLLVLLRGYRRKVI